jgi:hypothetical protein
VPNRTVVLTALIEESVYCGHSIQLVRPKKPTAKQVKWSNEALGQGLMV